MLQSRLTIVLLALVTLLSSVAISRARIYSFYKRAYLFSSLFFDSFNCFMLLKRQIHQTQMQQAA